MCVTRDQNTAGTGYIQLLNPPARMWTSAQSNSFCFKCELCKIITKLLFSRRTFGKCNLPPPNSARIYQPLPLRSWLCACSLYIGISRTTSVSGYSKLHMFHHLLHRRMDHLKLKKIYVSTDLPLRPDSSRWLHRTEGLKVVLSN